MSLKARPQAIVTSTGQGSLLELSGDTIQMTALIIIRTEL